MFETLKQKIFGIVTPPKPVVCPSCKKEIPGKDIKEAHYICPECGKYLRVSARDRIEMTVDKGSFKEMFNELTSRDFLNFPGYSEKLKSASESLGENDAVVCGTASIGGVKTAIFVMDSRFIMASMGSVVGEKITRTFEYATKKKLPVIGFTASGGARMQEGIISLMQMAKVSGAVGKHSEAGLLYVTVLTDPTTGGVTASFAMQGDILIAEPGALIGFAGRRVVEQTTGTSLPDNFQKAEFLLKHGFIDSIVSRDKMTDVLCDILRCHEVKVS